MKRIVLVNVVLLVLIKSGEAFECLREGNFPDTESSDCTAYFACSGIDPIAIRTICENGTFFNSELEECLLAENFVCPYAVTTDLTTETPIDVTTSIDVTTTTTTATPIVFECPDVGLYVDQNSTDCTSYISCIRQLDGTFLQLTNKCLLNTVFNPASRLCVSKLLYTCAPTATTPNDTLYQCPGIGYFADPSSEDCVDYFYCARKLDLSLEAKGYSCPKYTIFNAALRLCVLSSLYTCPLTPALETTTTPPEITTQSNVFICPDVGNYINEDSVDCRSYYSCTRNLQQKLVSKLTNCTANTNFDPARRMCVTSFYYQCPTTDTTPPPTFDCPSVGYFADPNAEKCKTYWYCIRNLDLTLQATLYSCLGSTVFDNVRRLCVIEALFKCPIV